MKVGYYYISINSGKLYRCTNVTTLTFDLRYVTDSVEDTKTFANGDDWGIYFREYSP